MGPFDSITVFGGATVDRIAAAIGATALGASNPGTVRAYPGGVGLNVARGLSRLGHRVRLISRIGSDADGEMVKAAAWKAGIDTSDVTQSDAAPTATYQAAFDHEGSLVIGIADMAVFDEITPSAIAGATTGPSARTLWVIDANLPADTLDFIIGEAAENGVPVAALTVSPAKAERLAPLLDKLTLLIANRREAAAVLDFYSSPGRSSRPSSPEFHSSPGRAARPSSPEFHSSPGQVSRPSSPEFHSNPGRASRPSSPEFHSSPGRASRPSSPEFHSNPGRAWRPSSPLAGDDHLPSTAELARAISRQFTPNVVISNGGEPLVVGIHGDVRAFAPFKAQVKSANGAGDGLAAGTIHGLALGHSLFEAVRSGLATAAIAIESEEAVSAALTPALVASRGGTAA